MGRLEVRTNSSASSVVVNSLSKLFLLLQCTVAKDAQRSRADALRPYGHRGERRRYLDAGKRSDARPVKRGTGVGLAIGRNVAMTDRSLQGVRSSKRVQERIAQLILSALVVALVGAFEFDADREIVAPRSSTPR